MITLMTDASWCDTARVGGYGCWVAHDARKMAVEGRIPTDCRNSSEAELWAVILGLQAILAAHETFGADNVVLVQSDCAHVVGVLRNEREVRPELMLELSPLRNTLRILAKHVRAHTGATDRRSLANNHCDIRAKRQMRAARNEKEQTQCKKEA